MRTAPISTQRAPVFSPSMSGTSPGVSVSAVLITRTSPHAGEAASGTVIVCAGFSPYGGAYTTISRPGWSLVTRKVWNTPAGT